MASSTSAHWWQHILPKFVNGSRSLIRRLSTSTSDEVAMHPVEDSSNGGAPEAMFWQVLDHGFVRCEDVFGSEVTIVNAARVSFGKRKEELDEKDARLIGYLLKHRHYSPFRHVMFRFHIKAPEFVMRQWYKHVVGCEWTSTHPTQLHGWNEISGRYVESFDFYTPDVWRQQSASKKQGSDGTVEDQADCAMDFRHGMQQIFEKYRILLRKGVATEQARIMLPLNVYTEVIWTTSLQALFHFIHLRLDEHAQYEIREYAKVFADVLRTQFPIVWKYYEECPETF